MEKCIDINRVVCTVYTSSTTTKMLRLRNKLALILAAIIHLKSWIKFSAIYSEFLATSQIVKKKFVATISTIFPQLSLLFFLAAIHISGVHPDNVIWTVPVEKIFARSKHSEIGQAALHWVISLLKKLIQFHLSWSGDNYKLALIPAAPLCCRRKMCPNKSQLCSFSIFHHPPRSFF